MNKYITKKQFKRFLVSQPFFIWNTLNKNEDFEEIDEFMQLEWDEDNLDLLPNSFGQKIAKTFRVIDEWLIKYLIKNYDCEVIKGNQEEKIEQTKKMINSNKMLLSPVFKYENAICNPFAFDSKNNVIINIKYSICTKLDDVLNNLWDYMIISKNVYVKDIFMFLPKDKIYKKNEIDLRWINYSTTGKTAIKPDDVNQNGEPKAKFFMELFENLKGVGNFGEKKFLFFPILENVIEAIDKARDVKNFSTNLEDDITDWGVNPEWNKLLEVMNNPFANFNNKVISKKQIASEFYEPIDLNSSELNKLYFSINKTNEVFINKKLLDPFHKIKNSKTVIWYDFEGFSLPWAAIDNTKPYQQIVFQVSVIKTENNKEINKQNIVIDPQTISSNDFIKILRIIYDQHADAYVVYNKGYELTRMKEMLEILKKENHIDKEEFAIYLHSIIEKTIDLSDLFIVNSKSKIPSIVLPDQKLKYSIKSIEKHITTNKIKLPRPIIPYKNLEIFNGAIAMEVAIDRALNIIGQNVWFEKSQELKKYCENDVRAMIMVYDYVNYLIEKDKYVK